MQKSNKPAVKYITDFLDYCEVEKGLSEKTQENYARYLNTFTKWLQNAGKSGLLPHQITPELIWEYRLYLARKHKTQGGENLKKSTQNYYLIALRALLDFFTDRDIDSLPSSKIKLAKDAGKQDIKFLKLEDIAKLLEAPKINTKSGLRDRAILETLFSTGLRISELTSLNRNQIHFKEKDGLEVSITGKGNSTRTVYFSPRALEWLKKYLDTRDDDDKALFVHYKSRRKDEDSRRLTARSVQASIKKYSMQAGLPITVTPHTLRHSYATDLLVQGVDLRTVQEFLGHKNIATTQIYTHVTNRRLRDIHKKYHGGNKLDKEEQEH